MKKLIIANWKMQLSPQKAKVLAQEVFESLKKNYSVNLSKTKFLTFGKLFNKTKEKGKKLINADIVLCPSFIDLPEVCQIFEQKKGIVSCGAQNCFWEENGEFTGEISPKYLKRLGCNYIILGHSERRQNLRETNEMVCKKVKVVLKLGMIPIICVGETMEQRRKGLKEYIIIEQISKALKGIDLRPSQKIVIAYEPVWVIGSGKAINPKEAGYMCKIIHQQMIDLYPLPIVRNNIRIVYGGSVDSTTIRSFVNQETIDGVLIGEASLKADEFVKMCELVS